MRLDKICDASKNALETREASSMIGKQFLKAVLPVSDTASLENWQQLLDQKQVYSHFPIVYSLYAKDMGFDLYTTVLTFYILRLLGWFIMRFEPFH